MPTCIDCGAAFGTQRSRSPRCETCRKERHLKQCRDWNKSEHGRPRVRAAQKKYQAEHPDRVRESHYKWVEKNRESYLAYKRENDRLRRKNKKAAVTPAQWMEKREAQMQYCDRIKARMLHLPCGSRDECFGRTRCEKCPPDAKPPRRDLFGIVE